MNIDSLKYCIRQSVVMLTRSFWLAVVTAGMIAVSLAILGGFMLIALNAGQFVRSIESNVEIIVFLEDNADVEIIRRELDKLAGAESYRFVSKEQGLEEFSLTLGNNVPLRGLSGEDNPLPDLFRVRASRAELVPDLAREIQAYPGVEMTDYGEKLVGLLMKVTGWLNTLFLGMSSFLALGAVFLIMTTIRLSVLARQEEIGVMKYLGASDWFIRFPFLLEGMVMGWVGTVAATAALGFVYYRVAASLRQEALAFFLHPVTDFAKLFPLFFGLMILGTLMCGIGSIVSIRKFLHV